jgi:large subunit ribosomal protein L10
MTREEKSIAIEDLTAQWYKYCLRSRYFWLNADTTSKLRRACFKAGIKLECKKYFACKQWKLLKMIMVSYHQF